MTKNKHLQKLHHSVTMATGLILTGGVKLQSYHYRSKAPPEVCEFVFLSSHVIRSEHVKTLRYITFPETAATSGNPLWKNPSALLKSRQFVANAQLIARKGHLKCLFWIKAPFRRADKTDVLVFHDGNHVACVPFCFSFTKSILSRLRFSSFAARSLTLSEKYSQLGGSIIKSTGR